VIDVITTLEAEEKPIMGIDSKHVIVILRMFQCMFMVASHMGALQADEHQVEVAQLTFSTQKHL